MDELKVSIIQTELAWENPVENLSNLEDKLSKLPSTNLVVLPEMFTTGFTMNAESCAEKTNGATLKWMQSMANQYSFALTGSIIVEEDGKYFNRLFFVRPDGSFQKYDKRHTFTLAGEDKIYSAGNKKLIVEYLGFRICPMICYDLRFPVWVRNVEDYDLLLFVANWPERRVAAWDALLKARAIENMAYCIGVNRIGKDGNGHPYSGHSAVYDVLGERITKSPLGSEFSETLILNKEHIDTLRDQLQFLADRDQFSLE